MTTTKNTTTDQGPEAARRALDAKLGELVTKLDRLHTPGAMTHPEKTALQTELGAPNEDAARRALKWEAQRVRNHLELLDERTAREAANTAPDAAAIAAQARSEIEALTPLRARLAMEVLVEQRPGRMALLEETEDRLRRLELEAERAALVAAEYPN